MLAIDDLVDSGLSACLRCGHPCPDPNGPDICQDCRTDIWEWAESYGGSQASINLRVVERFNDIRQAAREAEAY